MKIKWKQEVFILSVWIIPVIFFLVIWKSIPEQVPMHFNASGEVDNTFSKIWYIIMPLLLYFLFLLLPILDPKKRVYEAGNTYFKLRLLIQFFVSIVNVVVIINLLYHSFSINKVIPMLIMALFAILGNYLGILKQNYFVGFKTPWTLNNEEVWRRTHVLAGKLWFTGGILAIILMIFIDNVFWIQIPILIIITLVPIIYSYYIHKKIVLSK